MPDSSRFFPSGSLIEVLIAYNSVYYLPVIFFFKLKPTDELKEMNFTCDFNNEDQRTILTYMDMSNRVIMPFCIMTFVSIMLLISIIRLKKRISETFQTNQTKSFHRKDIQLSVSLIFMNFIYVAFNLPLSIASFFSFSNYFFVLTFYLLYVLYAINFYLIIMSNSLFRKEFINLLRIAKGKIASKFSRVH